MISTFKTIEFRTRHTTQQEGEEAAVWFHASKNPQAKSLSWLSLRFLAGTFPPREEQYPGPLLCIHLPLLRILFSYCPFSLELQEKLSGV